MSSEPVSHDTDHGGWTVSTHATIGRILTATRDIKPWETVISDTALIIGPKVMIWSKLV